MTPVPSWSHQRAVVESCSALRAIVIQDDVIEVLTAPADVYLGPRTLVQPDIFLVRSPKEATRLSWKDMPTPLLAIEILSPSTAARDRGKKRRIYLEAGVEEYWIVDVDGEVVERWRLSDERPEIVDQRLAWSLSVGVAGEIELPKVFGRIKR